MRWQRPIITDSGGFQVFSMGHGGVADEIKGRGAPAAPPGLGAARRSCAIEEEGVRFRSYVDGSERFLAPETSMAVQAALRSDIALVFDECTPFHVDPRLHRALDRAHASLARALPATGTREHGPQDQVVYGIVQGGVYHDLRVESTAAVAASGCDGIAIGGSLGQDKPQMYEVVDWATAELERLAPAAAAPPARDRRHRRPDRAASSSGSTRSTARCRRGSAATAWRSCPTPRAAGASTCPRAAGADSQEPIIDGCPCPACAAGFTRGYLHYLLQGRRADRRCGCSRCTT